MMTFASEVTKDYTYKCCCLKKYAESASVGRHTYMLIWITIPQDYHLYQYDLDDLFSGAASALKTEVSVLHSPFKVMPLWHHHIPDKPERATWRTGYPRPSTSLWRKGYGRHFTKHLKTLTEFYIEVKERTGTEALKKIEEKAYAIARKDTSGNGRIHPQPEHHALREKSSRIQFHQLWNRHFSRRPHGHGETAESYHRRPGYPWRSTSLPHTDIQS